MGFGVFGFAAPNGLGGPPQTAKVWGGGGTPNYIFIFVEYVIWNLLKFLKLKLSLLWIFIVLDEKNI